MFVRKVFRKISLNLDNLESDLLKDRQDNYFFDAHMLFVDLAPLQSSYVHVFCHWSMMQNCHHKIKEIL